MSRALLRRLVLLPFLTTTATAGTLLVAPVAAPALATQCSAATWSHHVALVVEHGDGASVRVCIGFDATAISGAQVLAASRLEYATAQYGSLGDAVCQVDHEPATYPPSCWTSSSPYWALFVSRGGGAWQASSVGIDSLQLGDGDAEGFRYESQSGAVAAPVSAAGTCTAALISPTGAPPSSAATGTAPTPAVTVPAAPTQSAPTTEPTAGVAAVTSSPAAVAPPPGVSPALLAAVVAAGALAGLLTTQLLLRRRRR